MISALYDCNGIDLYPGIEDVKIEPATLRSTSFNSEGLYSSWPLFSGYSSAMVK